MKRSPSAPAGHHAPGGAHEESSGEDDAGPARRNGVSAQRVRRVVFAVYRVFGTVFLTFLAGVCLAQSFRQDVTRVDKLLGGVHRPDAPVAVVTEIEPVLFGIGLGLLAAAALVFTMLRPLRQRVRDVPSSD